MPGEEPVNAQSVEVAGGAHTSGGTTHKRRAKRRGQKHQVNVRVAKLNADFPFPAAWPQDFEESAK